MKKALLFFWLVSVFCGCSCKDDPPAPAEPTLPPITQTGENTFGCYVNGELWLPKGSFSIPSTAADYYNNSVYITANREGQNPDTYIRLDFGKVYSDTAFVIHNYLDSDSLQYFVYNSSYYPSGPIVSYYPIAINGGELNLLKLDTVNRIVAGTFYFLGVDTLSGDSVRIEDGRFDLHY